MDTSTTLSTLTNHQREIKDLTTQLYTAYKRIAELNTELTHLRKQLLIAYATDGVK